MAEHTPGPWSYDPPRWTDAPAWINGPDGQQIAFVQGPHRSANGQLIAAVPELLGAIQGMLELAAPCHDCDGSGLDPHGDACRRCGGVGEECDIGPELHGLRQLLVKARGEEVSL